MTWVDKIKDAVDFIEANLFETVTAETVGDAINYAPSSFSNNFSAVTGYTIGEYVRFRRLSWAADRLAERKASVSDTAFDCGYETVEAFSKAFKRLFGCSPSTLGKPGAAHPQFAPIQIDFNLKGGFTMRRNLIPNLLRVDWSDTLRQNEFVNSVVSALNGLGEKLDYDTVCAISGCAFRTSFSRREACEWNHGNYHVINTPPIVEHTFKMLGYAVTNHPRGDYETDRKLVMDSIDRGSPVITVEGVISCADACVIGGYDNDGDVLLGYNPFMDIEDDHKEAPDDTGYFRKSGWHDGFFAQGQGRLLLIEGKRGKPDADTIREETLALVARLIREEPLVPTQHNGLAAHRAFAEALQTYEWEDNFEPYLNVMCNTKQYLDRRYAVPFLRSLGRDDLADVYAEIAERCEELGRIIPQDFSAGELFSDKAGLKPYCDVLMQIAAAEERVLSLIG